MESEGEKPTGFAGEAQRHGCVTRGARWRASNQNSPPAAPPCTLLADRPYAPRLMA